MILAANHRSFLDPFIIGICLRRPVYFVAKQELFRRRWQGWILNALGAFPVRRGEHDEEMMATARAVLERGDPVVIFPEGTRIRNGTLGRPKRGAGRLALETGAPIVPIAVTGTENARRGWLIRPAKVRIRCGRPLTFPPVEQPSPKPGDRGDGADLALRGAPVGLARRTRSTNGAPPRRRSSRRRTSASARWPEPEPGDDRG